jgi:acyl-CoA thioesterase-1
MRILALLLALASLAPMAFGQKKVDPAFAPVTDDPALPRVLIIGDSISIGYTPAVRAALKGKANVHRNAGNAESTVTGLAKLDEWLGGKKWDVIHFNWGLHDLKHFDLKTKKLDPTKPVWVPLADYEKNLGALVKRLKATGARLIFATTTPVPAGADGREPGIEVRYNEAALRVMKANGVAIDDLQALCAPNLAEWQLPKNVHFKAPGSKALGDAAAKTIEAALAK